MCVASLFGGSKKSGDLDEIREKIRKLGGDPTGLGALDLAKEYRRLSGIQKNGGTTLPFVAPAPNPSPTMGLRLPRTPASVSSLKLPRR